MSDPLVSAGGGDRLTRPSDGPVEARTQLVADPGLGLGHQHLEHLISIYSGAVGAVTTDLLGYYFGLGASVLLEAEGRFSCVSEGSYKLS